MAFPFLRGHVGPRTIVAVLAFVSIGAIISGYFLQTHRPVIVQSPVRDPLPPGTYPIGPLSVGTIAPDFHAAGWINGPAPPRDKHGPRFIVLDIWAHWCPACRETAPGLVQVHRKYHNRGVEFVSLSNVSRRGAEIFAKSADIPWPCGYDATLQDLAAFGAYSPTRMSKRHNPGYEVTPTIYVLDTDGRVVWNDRQARPLHLKESAALVRELDAEIDHLLSSGAGSE